MKFQLVSRQTTESMGAAPGTPNTQLVFSGVDNDNTPASPGVYYNNISIAVSQAAAAAYELGGYYEMALSQAEAEP